MKEGNTGSVCGDAKRKGYLLATTIVLAYVLLVIAIHNQPWNNFLEFVKLFLNKEGILLTGAGISYKLSASILFFRARIPLSVSILDVIEVVLLITNMTMIVTLLIINPHSWIDYISGIAILSVLTFVMFSSAKKA
ncbi:MAG: hypothetical protein ACI88L_000356 [Candidatus Paceibacteria bacterium]|jgi:hypothetical protein